MLTWSVVSFENYSAVNQLKRKLTLVERCHCIDSFCFVVDRNT